MTQNRNRIHSAEMHKPRSQSAFFIQPKRSTGAASDTCEKQAAAVAGKVLPAENSAGTTTFFRPAYSPVQSKYEHSGEGERKMQRKEASVEGEKVGLGIESYVHSLGSKGQALPHELRSFFEPRMQQNFADVRIHTDSAAAKSAKSINAQAYTSGNNIVFDTEKYAPGTGDGKKLLGHELTHVIQQKSGAVKPPGYIQRMVHTGTDWAGHYSFDDNACTLNYAQDWYFQFPSSLSTAAQQTSYMAAAESQVESVWSHKHRLMPSGTGCACGQNGVDVSVDLVTHNEPRDSRHGYGVNVITDATTGLTTLPTRTMTLHESHGTAVNMGDGITQQRIAHEFGHTLNMNDEYTGWASFWAIPGASDRRSIMYHGDEVRPRHYQPFADMISTVLEGCLYRPAGSTSSTLVNPVTRLGITGGLSLDNAQFILDLSVDRRLGNSDILGLFTPRLGFDAMFNAANGNLMFGPTLGFSLNRFQHPVYVDVRSGVLFDPEDPGRPAALNIPASVTAGFRGDGFTAGINYTGMIDVLGNNGYTHVLGVNLQFDLPGGR